MNNKTNIISGFSFLNIAVFTIFISCKKDPKIEPQNNTSNSQQIHQPDSIYYKDIVPDTIINSIRGTSYYSSPANPLCTRPVPTDSSANIFLDLDGNLTMDIHINPVHSFTQISVSDCGSTFGHIFITCINSTDGIITADPKLYGQGNPFVNYFNAGDTISNNNNCLNYVRLTEFIMYAPLYPPNLASYSGEHYLGIKRTINSKVYFGWLHFELVNNNGVKIKEFAINKTSGNSIIVGQKN
jgi:hypothetical protein